MNLIISYYQDKFADRMAELDFCLLRNLENPLITKIHCFTDCDIQNDKIIKIQHSGRPTFDQLFRYANGLQGIKIIANLDIYFDETLELASYLHNNEIFCLCRYNDETFEFYDKSTSQDAWIFADKINVNAEVMLGVPGCDNSLAYCLDQAGYNVSAPSFSIHVIHRHKVLMRNYEIENLPRVPKPYLFLIPHEIGQETIKEYLYE